MQRVVNIQSGTPNRKTVREPHRQHHTPVPQTVEQKSRKGVLRNRKWVSREVVRTEKLLSGKISKNQEKKLDAIAKKMKSK